MNGFGSLISHRVAPGGKSLVEQAQELDPVMDWQARVTASGGSASASTIAALYGFYLGCQADGIWGKLSRVNLFCGSSLTACLVPLIVGSGGATDTNNGFVGGDFSEASGLTGSTSKFLDSGFVPGAATGGLGVYVRSGASNASTRTPIGCQDSGTQLYRLRQSTTDVTATWGSSGSTTTVAGTFGPGFWQGTRTSSTSLVLYQNAASVATRVIATTPASPGTSLYVMAYNSNGTMATPFSGGVIAGYTVDTGLTAGEVTALYNRIQAFNTALGRNV